MDHRQPEFVASGVAHRRYRSCSNRTVSQFDRICTWHISGKCNGGGSGSSRITGRSGIYRSGELELDSNVASNTVRLGLCDDHRRICAGCTSHRYRRFARVPASWTAQANQSWIVLPVLSGTVPAQFSVSVNSTGLNPGTYNGSVQITANGLAGSPASIPVTLTISPVMSALQLSPPGLNFIATANRSASAIRHPLVPPGRHRAISLGLYCR